VERRPDQLLVSLLSAAFLLVAVASAQQATDPATPTATPSQPASGQATAGAKTFTQQELDQLLAPIALYPDDVLAQILMASTYPLEVVQAARWRAANPNVKDKALEDAMQKQTWDASVKGLTSVPQALKQMDENLEWTEKLGDAFLAQQSDVMDTVQALRAKAQANGNLKSSPEMAVKTESAENKTVYVIESTKTETVYVPTYNPSVVYGAWAYPAYPPYYVYPPAYVYPPGLTFAAGVFVGAAIWGNCGWGQNNVYINHNTYNNFNRTNIGNGNTNWQHNVEHRGGVPYRDQNVANKYNRGGDNRAQSRDSFRGREQGSSFDRGGPSASTRDMSSRNGASASTRESGSRDLSSRNGASASTREAGSRGSNPASSRGGGSSGGFSGMNSGSGTRAASSRGGSSFGGGRQGGGGGRRR
jgi:hypothetical protein